MSRILLCHPLFLQQNLDEQAVSSPYFPLGLLYLASYLRQRGHQVSIFDATFATDESEFLAGLSAGKPDVVGISALTPNRTAALRLAAMARRLGALVILGGPDPTREPHDYLCDPAVDLVVHHEGEETLAVLLDHLAAGNLTDEVLEREPGIAFRRGDQVIVNPPRAPIEDLDSLPPPARDLIDMPRYLAYWKQRNGYASLTISTARGCPYGCKWCRDAVHGNEFRQRSPQHVAAEVRAIQETYQVDRLRVVDDVDGFSRRWLEEWANSAADQDAIIPFEALNELRRQDIPMLDVRDSL